MRRYALAAGALVVFALGGCMTTYRVEQSSVVNAGVSSDGTSSCCSQSNRAERLWRGPCLGQPDHICP
jgi:hypothetical protein